MNDNLKQAAQQALEALKQIDKDFKSHGRQHWPEAVKARAALPSLRAALAEPVQEPVAWVDLVKEAQAIVESKPVWKRFIAGTPLSNDIAVWMADFAEAYTAPPQRNPLTEEEIAALTSKHFNGWVDFIRAVERAHGING